MTKHRFNMRGKDITSLVMDKKEFNELCDLLEGIKLSKVPNWKQQVQAIRSSDHLPLVTRGTETACIFEKYQVETHIMTACIRGFANKGVVTVERETAIHLIEGAYQALPEEVKQDVNHTAEEILKLLKAKKELDVPHVLTAFTGKYMKNVDRGLRLAHLEDLTRSLFQTMIGRATELGDPFGPDFDGYLQRLLTGTISTAEMFKKGQNN